MKKLLYLSLLAAAISGSLALAAREPGKRAVISTTIDFTDYVFDDRLGHGYPYYPLEFYEQRIRDLAESGIDRVLIRVNACGLTLYPTKVSTRYGDEERYQWDSIVHARRTAATIRRYDPLAETIRLGHKYGMQVWCWESLCDEGGYSERDFPPELAEAAKKFNSTPMLETAYMHHPEWQAMKHPRYSVTEEQAREFNRKARELPIARIMMVDSVGRKGLAPHVKPEDVEIFVSSDNQNFRRYTAPFAVKVGRNADGVSIVDITNLNITEEYVKLAHPEYTDGHYTIVVNDEPCVNKVYNTKGEEIYTTWSTLFMRRDTKESTGFDFNNCEPAGWDSKNYQAGFMRGIPRHGNRYYRGIAEFAVPAARKFRLEKFAELAAYPFDGYMINMRTHSNVNNPDKYGFNPEVRAQVLARCGKDIWSDDSPETHEIRQQVRAEGVAEFLKGCKQLVGNRPLYISGISNWERTRYQARYGSLPWLYGRYFADGSVDGVMMMGADFRDKLLEVMPKDRRIAIGLFREMSAFRDPEVFASELERINSDPGIDEVELYESEIISYRPTHLAALKKATGKE